MTDSGARNDTPAHPRHAPAATGDAPGDGSWKPGDPRAAGAASPRGAQPSGHRSEVPGSLAEALITLQANLPYIRKDAKGQAGNRETRYADLSAITEIVFPMLTALGLYWTCLPTMQEGVSDRFVLRYRLEHQPTGEFLTGDYPLPVSQPQTMGGSITYARRYALCAVLGLAPAEDDDDANTAAQEARDRQNMRTRQGADESVHSPPPHARPAERVRGRLPDDEWTTGGTR
jgi:ERF superfamily